MGIKLTAIGLENMENKIKSLNLKLDAVRDEKNVAYNNSGDTWHDNPMFKILEQEESSLNRQIQELESILKKAEVIEVNSNNTETVEIGSIVHCHCIYPSFEEDIAYEIVGFGESDLDQGKIFYDSLVGKHLMGLSVGEETSFETPGGKVTYKILKLHNSWDSVDQSLSNI